jgi:ParB family chromosome partitioning protein
MKLDFINLDALSVSKANMRSGAKARDIADILPSVRARGILVPLLVRANGSEAMFEIVAGRRRYHAALACRDEDKDLGALPCAIMQDGDDAAALEASLIENVARLDPDEVTQWESFTRLVKQGKSAEHIAATFGLAQVQVKRILALGNLLPRIRDLYRKEQIDAATVRHLTLASKMQQKDWLALYDSEDSSAPTGHALKSWLFGGQSVATDKALFDLAEYAGTIVTDLFGEGGYFGSADEFWAAQNAAIDARKAAYLDAGWKEVVVLSPTDYFSSWEYEKTPKRKGGKVYVAVRSNGEVAFHEGYLSRAEARKCSLGSDREAAKPKRPELTGPLNTYVDLHRHAAVRAGVAARPAVAFRLMVAHGIVGSALWSVRADPQSAHSEAIAESVETCSSEAVFDVRRRAALALLGFSPDEPRVTGGAGHGYDADRLSSLFIRLLALTDEQVMDIAAVVMAETLGAGSEIVETVGLYLNLDMADVWQADGCFFDLLRDREVLTCLVGEVACDEVASANAEEKAKALKAVLSDCLNGENGRVKVEGWVPRWMRFAPSAYTERGGVGTVVRFNRVASLFEPSSPDPDPIASDAEQEPIAADAVHANAPAEADLADAA